MRALPVPTAIVGVLALLVRDRGGRRKTDATAPAVLARVLQAATRERA